MSQYRDIRYHSHTDSFYYTQFKLSSAGLVIPTYKRGYIRECNFVETFQVYLQATAK